MKSHTEYLTFKTKRQRDYINITREVEAALKKSGIREGMILVSAMLHPLLRNLFAKIKQSSESPSVEA